MFLCSILYDSTSSSILAYSTWCINTNIYIYSQSLIKKIQLYFNWILNFAPRVSFNFVTSELLSVKIEESKSNSILNYISIVVQFSVTCLSKFLIFVANKLLGAKTEKYKTN